MVGTRDKRTSLVESGDGLFYAINNGIIILAVVVVLYPLIYIVSASFSSPQAVSTGRVWLFPVDLSLAGYQAVFSNPSILSGYWNSIVYTVIGTMVNLAMTVAVAYPLARKSLRSRNFFMVFFVFTMYFQGGLIPTYILISRLGLINTRMIMWIGMAIGVYNVIITRTFFQSYIPDELIEAAQIDGMSDFGIMVKIFLPLSTAIIAVISLFYAVQHWNVFFFAFIYLNDKKLFPLQLILREILILNTIDYAAMSHVDVDEMAAREGMSELLKYSLIIVASVPVLMIYPFVQRYFVQGVMIGSLKG